MSDASESVAFPHVFPSFRSSETYEILRSLAHRMTLIQGPPGTEKIKTLVNIAYYLWNETGSAVLICASSNTAIANLMEMLLEIDEDFNIIRVNSKGELFNRNDKMAHRSLDRLVLEKHPELWMLQSSSNSRDRLRPKKLNEWNERKELKKMTENELLEKADFVLCLCSAAGDDRLAGHTFQSCIIDECGQAVETETKIRLFRSDRVVLIGELNQLAPTGSFQIVVKTGTDISLF